jgi:hypothetical protein
MPNPNPLQGRLTRKQMRKPGDLAALTRVLWRAILEAQEIMDRAETDELRLRAIHAIGQTAGTYTRLVEIGEYESRLQALEAAARGQAA